MSTDERRVIVRARIESRGACHAEQRLRVPRPYPAKDPASTFRARSFASTLRTTTSAIGLLICVVALLPAIGWADSVGNKLGWTLTVNEDGSYAIAAKDPAWTIGGSVGKSVGKIAT